MSLLSNTPCAHCNGSGREFDLSAVNRFIDRQKLTNTALAQRLRVHVTYASHLRTGKRRWTPALIELLTEGGYRQDCIDTP